MKAIEKLRAAGFSIAEIATAIGLTRTAVGHWTRGKRSPNHDNREKLIALAETKGILLLGSDFSNKKQDESE